MSREPVECPFCHRLVHTWVEGKLLNHMVDAPIPGPVRYPDLPLCEGSGKTRGACLAEVASAERETRAILADPEAMAAIAEAEGERPCLS